MNGKLKLRGFLPKLSPLVIIPQKRRTTGKTASRLIYPPIYREIEAAGDSSSKRASHTYSVNQASPRETGRQRKGEAGAVLTRSTASFLISSSPPMAGVGWWSGAEPAREESRRTSQANPEAQLYHAPTRRPRCCSLLRSGEGREGSGGGWGGEKPEAMGEVSVQRLPPFIPTHPRTGPYRAALGEPGLARGGPRRAARWALS